MTLPVNNTLQIRPRNVVAKQRIHPMSYAHAFFAGNAEDEIDFRDKMGRRLGLDVSLIPLGRARVGIYLLTKMSLKKGRRKVLLSPYTIPDVVTMVLLAGGEPVFFDFEANSTFTDIESFSRLIGDDTACAFITHYHVNEPKLAELKQICSRYGTYLFDDCAIALGGSIGASPLGTLTDASVFSFSAFKLLNFFWGGLITTRNPEIASQLSAEVGNWPRLTARDYLVPAKKCIQYDLASRPIVFDKVVFPMFQRRTLRARAPFTLENLRVETKSINPTLTSRPSYAAFAEWSRKLEKIDEWLSHRRVIAALYRERLGNIMVSADASFDVVQGSTFMNFPVLVPEERRDDICVEMMVSGFDVGRNLYPNCHRHPNFIGVSGSSPNVDKLTHEMIYLPTHFAVTKVYAAAIGDRLLQLIDRQG